MMGLLNWIGIGKDIAEPINAIGNLYTKDKERLEGENKLQETINKPLIQQLHSKHIFESAWPALIGWTSGFLVLIYYAPQILIITYVWGANCIINETVTPFPMKPDDIFNLVWLLFGFGGYSIAKQVLPRR